MFKRFREWFTKKPEVEVLSLTVFDDQEALWTGLGPLDKSLNRKFSDFYKTKKGEGLYYVFQCWDGSKTIDIEVSFYDLPKILDSVYTRNSLSSTKVPGGRFSLLDYTRLKTFKM